MNMWRNNLIYINELLFSQFAPKYSEDMVNNGESSLKN